MGSIYEEVLGMALTKNEQKNREELFKLMQEHPELPIVAMVDSEIVADDGYNRWLGAWGSSYIGEYLVGEEQVHFRDDDDPEEIDRVVEGNLDSEAWGVMSDEEYLKAYKEMPWVKAIIVNIDLPD
jgi:hypothetical protein